MKTERLWEFKKELLGQIIDSLNRTTQLRIKKYKKIKEQINTGKKKEYLEYKQLQKLHRSGYYAAIGASLTNGLFLPLNNELGKDIKIYQLKKVSALVKALENHFLIAKLTSENPTRIDQIILRLLDILLKWAIRGVINCTKGLLKPLIFKLYCQRRYKQHQKTKSKVIPMLLYRILNYLASQQG